MSRPPVQQYSGHPSVGATFVPGGSDDFYLPEVVSPKPKRLMPEVPQNMQQNIAHLEYEARAARPYGNQSPYERPQYPERSSSVGISPPVTTNPYDPPSVSSAPAPYGQPVSYDTMDQPSFSPFPVLRNPPPNVPPSDEQREANLEKGRQAVLASNDPDAQLAWAQDALNYVEMCMQNESRMSQIQPPRPHTPQIEHQLKTDAINIVRFLADQHHPHADFIKGMWLEFGKFGYRVDKREAFRCYARAAEKGYARAEYRMGMQFESSNEPAKAIRHYERGVTLQDSASYYRLGMMILLGQHGQRQDYEKGLEYIRQAAETCDDNAPQGAYVYGMLLARELPQVNVPDQYLPVDINGARRYIEKAAFHGFAKAQVKMGAAYELCQLGCDFDPMLSLHYNLLAAKQGEPEAEMAISKWFLCGHEGMFEKNDEIAFTYAQRAAQSGLPTAEFALGYFYEVGIHVPVDLKEARAWYSKAAANGNKDAAGRIESISRSKTLSRKDHEQVAIARIKSQYGNGGRPARRGYGGNQNQGMAPPQENLEMPDPSRMTISDDGYSSAPYPTNGRVQYGPPPSSQPYPDSRQNSAFGINPNIHSPPANYGPGGPGSRTPSGGQMGYRPPTGSAPTSPRHPPPGQGDYPPVSQAPPQSPRPDFGYSAPMDNERRRLQRPDRPGTSGRPPQDAYGNGGPGRTPDGRPSYAYPPRNQSMPHSSQAPPHSPRPQGAPASQPSSSSSTPAPSRPGNLPGKGPKTFEEMGVPVAKNESDCVVM